MGVDNLLLSLHEKENNQLFFPICIVNGINMTLAPRALSEGYQETILELKEPILINRDVADSLAETNIDHSPYFPFSLLAVPLLTGDRGGWGFISF